MIQLGEALHDLDMSLLKEVPHVQRAMSADGQARGRSHLARKVFDQLRRFVIGLSEGK